MSDDPIADRRQRARELFQDQSVGFTGRLALLGVASEAIEVATQVKITDDIIHAACQYATVADMTSAVKAAFCAAGFEVVE